MFFLKKKVHLKILKMTERHAKILGIFFFIIKNKIFSEAISNSWLTP